MINRSILTLAAFCASSVCAFADYAFNDFSADFGYIDNSGYTVSGSSASNGLTDTESMQFTAAAGGSLTQIDIAAELFSGANSLTATLYNDNGGSIGSQLGTWTVSNEMVGSDLPNSINTFDVSSSGIQLTNGATYWLEASPGQPTTYAAWMHNNNSVEGDYIADVNGTDFTHYGVLGAFDVQVQATPEPASVALLGLGVAALARRRRARKQSRQEAGR